MKIIKAIIIVCITLISLLIFDVNAYADKKFVFDPKRTSWYAYEDGQLIASGNASGGANYCPDRHRPCHTPTGFFHVISKGGANCKSNIYPLPHGGAPMPFCMFFSKNYAIHGAASVPQGRNASHGCIRVRPSAAIWLSKNFIDIGTTVIVKSY